MSKKTEAADEPVQKKFESRYNAHKLREAINRGDSAVDIMNELGIKFRQTLKQDVLKLINDDRVFYEVKGLYLKNTRRPKVSSNGIIKIHVKDLDSPDVEFVEGDEFTVSIEDGKVILTKV